MTHLRKLSMKQPSFTPQDGSSMTTTPLRRCLSKHTYTRLDLQLAIFGSYDAVFDEATMVRLLALLIKLTVLH